jgi:hypothetical protein
VSTSPGILELPLFARGQLSKITIEMLIEKDMLFTISFVEILSLCRFFREWLPVSCLPSFHDKPQSAVSMGIRMQHKQCD